MFQFFLFHSNTTCNPDYGRRQLPKYCSQVEIDQAMHNSLYNKYSFAQNYYHTNKIRLILEDVGSPAIKFQYDKEFYNPKEYLKKYHKMDEANRKLKYILLIKCQQLVYPRFFLNPIKLELLMDKRINKKKKIIYQRQDEQLKQNQMIKLLRTKLNSFKPILKDLEQTTNPTTQVFVDLVKNVESSPHKNKLFLAELEVNSKNTKFDENNKTNQFDTMLKQNSILTTSTKITSKQSSQFEKQNSFLHSQRINYKVEQKQKPNLQINTQIGGLNPCNDKKVSIYCKNIQEQLQSMRNSNKYQSLSNRIAFYSPKSQWTTTSNKMALDQQLRKTNSIRFISSRNSGQQQQQQQFTTKIQKIR